MPNEERGEEGVGTAGRTSGGRLNTAIHRVLHPFTSVLSGVRYNCRLCPSSHSLEDLKGLVPRREGHFCPGSESTRQRRPASGHTLSLKAPSWALLQSDSELIHGNGGWKQNCLLIPHFFPRVPLRRQQSVRKKLRAQGLLSDFWKSQNLDMIQFTESCQVDQSTNEPLINYLDVRCLGLKPGDTGSREEEWAPLCGSFVVGYSPEAAQVWV